MTLYGCNTIEAGPRGKPTGSWMKDGFEYRQQDDGLTVAVQKMRWIETEWLTKKADGSPLKCGVLLQQGVPDDSGCIGCENRPVEVQK